MARPLLTALRFSALAALLAICASCDTPTDPGDPYAGRWSGTISDAALGPGTIEMTLSRDNTVRYRGSWRMRFASKEVTGSLDFFLDVLADSIFFMCVQLPLPPEDSSYGQDLSLLDIQFDGNQATGKLRPSIGARGCEGTRGGPVSLTRQ
jgi:hypothetical protein